MFMVIYAVLHRRVLSLEEAQGELIMTHLHTSFSVHHHNEPTHAKA